MPSFAGPPGEGVAMNDNARKTFYEGQRRTWREVAKSFGDTSLRAALEAFHDELQERHDDNKIDDNSGENR